MQRTSLFKSVEKLYFLHFYLIWIIFVKEDLHTNLLCVFEFPERYTSLKGVREILLVISTFFFFQICVKFSTADELVMLSISVKVSPGYAVRFVHTYITLHYVTLHYNYACHKKACHVESEKHIVRHLLA